MDLLPQTGGLQPFQLGQDINQITNIPQQNVIQNEQFLLYVLYMICFLKHFVHIFWGYFIFSWQNDNHILFENFRSRHMSMVNAGNSQVPVNQPARNMRNPYGAASNSYYYPTSNLPADYRLDPSPRPQVPSINTILTQLQLWYFIFIGKNDLVDKLVIKYIFYGLLLNLSSLLAFTDGNWSYISFYSSTDGSDAAELPADSQ